MRISIFGLGYVGSVSLGCLAQSGHTIIGVDISQQKVDFINNGKSPIIEPQLGRIIEEQHVRKSISATSDARLAVRETDVSFVCVGTPSTSQGHLNLDGIFKTAKDLALGLSEKTGFHVIAVRSTVLPGTNRKVTEIIEKLSGKKRDRDFAVVSNPEFLREGTAVSDFFHPAYTLIGSRHSKAKEVMEGVYGRVEAPIIFADVEVVEMIKYVNNSFHALKISFANEIGGICKKMNIDSHELMDIFCRDTKLNIAPYYLKPGFAYGGSCLPKDLKALCALAHDHYLKCPVLESIGSSNEIKKNQVLETIIEFGKTRIGFLGLSFKGGTDDLRDSPIIEILEKLLGKGYEIRIFDRNVQLSQLMGANREFILSRIPYISNFIVENAHRMVQDSDLIVVVNGETYFREILETVPPSTVILDLVNMDFHGRTEHPNYHGVAW